MRYEIGQKVLFLFFEYISNGGRKSPNWFSKPMPWECTIDNMVMQNMTVKEHYRVATEWVPNLKDSDGFIFEDEHGQVWYNQYPIANYEQTSDTANGIVEIAGDTNTFCRAVSMYDAKRFLDELLRGINQIEVSVVQPSKEYDNLIILKQHYAKVVEDIEHYVQCKVTLEPLSLKLTDGTTSTLSRLTRHAFTIQG